MYILSKRKSTFQLLIIMILVSSLVAGISIFIVFRVVVNDKKQHLKDLCENQTGIIKSIYLNRKDPEEVLHFLKRQRQVTPFIGKTGEFVIAYLKNDTIYFLLDQLSSNLGYPTAIPANTDIAQPIKAALAKRKGIIRGKDYRNHRVLAYCNYIPELNWGIVAKIDIAEVNKPFDKAGLFAALVSIILVSAGTMVFRKISDPITDKILENEEKIQAILDATQESIYLFDRNGRFQIANQIGLKRLNLKKSDILGHHFSEYMSPELASSREEYLDQVFTLGKPVIFEDIRNGQHFEHHFYPCYRNNEVSYVATYSRDVTDIRKKEQELIKLNQVLKALEKSSKAMLKASDEDSYLAEVCRIVVEDCNYSMVWIGFARENEAKSVEPVAYSGFEIGYLETLNITWDDSPRGHGPTGTAIRTGKPSICRNMDKDPSFAPWRKEALKRGYSSSLVLPLLNNGIAFGAINIYSFEPDSFSEQEVNFLSELASDLSYGIISIRLKTSQIRAEKELRHSEQRLKYYFDNSPLGVVEWDSKFMVTKWSGEARKIFGWSADETLGRNINSLNIIYQEDLPIVARTMERLTGGKENTVVSTNRNVRKSGEVIYCTWYNSVLYDDKGQMSSVMSLIDDFTERKHSEEALRESEEKLKLALENGSIGVWVWNVLTNEIEWDESMERIFGIEPGTFGGSYYSFEEFLVDEDIPHIRNAIKKALEESIPFETVYRIKSGKGDVKYISAKALVKKDNRGNAIRMTGVCYDVTEMKRDTEQLLFSLNEELLRSNKELEQFAYVASHDLQEPLRMVSSFTQLLAQRYYEKLDEDAKDFIKFAVDGANYMQTLINDLLAYSRIHTMGREFSKIDMNEVVTVAMFNLGMKIREKNVMITRDELPVLYADKGQMIQLFQNLIGNAVKFSGKSPVIHISGHEDTDQYVFYVKDNGIGIEKDYFEKVFQIFQRLHPKEEYEGTGIGLAVCKRIVNRHGGNIWIESEPGKGSTFYFNLKKNKIDKYAKPSHETD